jgi:DtxR family Mn-dependent transcriptional regulator
MANPLVILLVGLGILGIVLALVWPGRGLIARSSRQRRMTGRVLREDAVKHVFVATNSGHYPTLQSVAGSLEISTNEASDLLHDLEQRGLVGLSEGTLHLTDEGRSTALHVLRAHRLWERYLADETGYEETEWHDRAERYEHSTSLDELEEMAAQLGNPTYDPHGDPIPSSTGRMVEHESKPLNQLEAGEIGRIVHIEDEPAAIYAQLVAEGLFPGLRVQVLEKSPQRIRFWGNGDEHILAPVVAGNLAIAPMIAEPAEVLAPRSRLSDLNIGEEGRVTGISKACRGAERRRFMDLGVLPGTVISAEMISPSGDPTAYRIRDALIGLRSEQAAFIYIEPVTETDDTEANNIESRDESVSADSVLEVAT